MKGVRVLRTLAAIVCTIWLVWFVINYFVASANKGVDGYNFGNTVVQCIYRSYRFTGSWTRPTKELDPAMMACDKDHQFGFFDERFPTDKCGRHTYLPVYDKVFSPLRTRGRPVTLLEVGVKNGGSLMLWRSYFSFESRIFGLDINQAAPQFLKDPGIKVLLGDSTKDTFEYFKHNCLDIIIDDGLHYGSAIVQTFVNYYPNLCPGGLYAMEDVANRNHMNNFLTSRRLKYEEYPDPSGEWLFIIRKPE